MWPNPRFPGDTLLNLNMTAALGKWKETQFYVKTELERNPQ